MEVHVDMVGAAFQIGGRDSAVAVSVSIPVLWQQGRSLLTSPSLLPKVHDGFLQDEDSEEACSNDELWEWKAGLFRTKTKITGSVGCELAFTRI